MIINGLKIDADVVDILDVHAEALHEKNCLISAKDRCGCSRYFRCTC